MSTKARCKFRVTSITDHGNENKTIHLHTQYDTSVPEDQAFSKYTPSGSIDVQINNPAVVPMFTVGREFYVDLTPVD